MTSCLTEEIKSLVSRILRKVLIVYLEYKLGWQAFKAIKDSRSTKRGSLLQFSPMTIKLWESTKVCLHSHIIHKHRPVLVKLNLILPPDGCCNISNMHLQLKCHLVECVNPMRVCNLLLSDDQSKSASHVCDNFYHTFLIFFAACV